MTMQTAGYLFLIEKPIIDMQETGKKLKHVIISKGYSVRDIQAHLHLSCPQPVYRWFQGKIMPSIDHLFALSNLLGMHMEDLLTPITYSMFCSADTHTNFNKYLDAYINLLNNE